MNSTRSGKILMAQNDRFAQFFFHLWQKECVSGMFEQTPAETLEKKTWFKANKVF